jgi:hypothetical protein
MTVNEAVHLLQEHIHAGRGERLLVLGRIDEELHEACMFHVVHPGTLEEVVLIR